MASLWNKLQRIEEPKISAHSFASIFSLWAIGHYDGAGAQAALESDMNGYTLTAEEQTEATALKAKYDAAGPSEKVEWIVRLNVVALEFSTGRLSIADANALLTL